MYGAQQHAQGSTRMVGVSVTAMAAALVMCGVIFGVGSKVIVPIQRAMQVAIMTPPPPRQEVEPPKPIDADLKPTLDTPPPIPLPEIEFKSDDPPVVTATPTPVVEASPAPSAPAAIAADAKPRLITTTKPPYPPSAIRDKQQGKSALQLCVDASGKVTDAKLAASSGFPVLDDAALKWVAQARFKSGVKDGKPAAMCDYNIVYQWDLKDAR